MPNNNQLAALLDKKYLIVNLITDDDASTFEAKFVAVATGAGATFYDSYSAPFAEGPIDLFAHLGAHLLSSNARIMYMVNRAADFSVDHNQVNNLGMNGNIHTSNAYWWKRRLGKGDVVVDMERESVEVVL